MDKGVGVRGQGGRNRGWRGRNRGWMERNRGWRGGGAGVEGAGSLLVWSKGFIKLSSIYQYNDLGENALNHLNVLKL